MTDTSHSLGTPRKVSAHPSKRPSLPAAAAATARRASALAGPVQSPGQKAPATLGEIVHLHHAQAGTVHEVESPLKVEDLDAVRGGGEHAVQEGLARTQPLGLLTLDAQGATRLQQRHRLFAERP